MSMAERFASFEHRGDRQETAFLYTHGLIRGAVYALAVETAAARLGLIVAPLRAALSAERPCALITPLSPEQFAGLICRARNAKDVAASIKSGRLKLFTAVGDYATNLFLHGAARYVRELDQFDLEKGSLVVVDQADDLFTQHDHFAVVNQARTYQEWCELKGHTMLQLHLRASIAYPMLGGNQAAAQYFSGMARVTSEAGGVCMRVDFWRTIKGYSTGVLIDLGRQVQPAPPSVDRQAFGSAKIDGESQGPRFGHRRTVWYLGHQHQDASLEQVEDQIKWRFARSLDDLIQRARHKKGSSVVISLAGPESFWELMDRMAELRTVFSNGGRIVVRESSYRLRDHPQKRMLALAGVDHLLAASEPLNKLPELLDAPRPSFQYAAKMDAEATLRGLLSANGQEIGARWLPPADFALEAQKAMRQTQSLGVPCALAELRVEGDAGLTKKPENGSPTRPGDLMTSAGDVQLFFMGGCRELDVMRVLARWASHSGVGSLHRVSLFTGESAIAERLEALCSHEEHDTVAVDVALGKVPNNIVTLPGSSKVALSYGHLGIASAVASIFCLLFVANESFAGESAPNAVAISAGVSGRTASQAYEEARYTEAARLGLLELEGRGTDHNLRFKVANSLAWTGQYREAIAQYEALMTSPLVKEASIGLANVYLWSGRPELADPLFRRVLKASPDNSVAQSGLDAAGRHLRPRTAIKAGWMDDSSNTERSGLNLAHRWRDSSLRQIFEVAAEGNREDRSPAIPELSQREWSFSYEHLGLALMPKVQAAVQNSPTSKVFGGLTFRLAEGAVAVDAGRVNWGKLVFDPRALNDGLTANRAGIEGRLDTTIGNWNGGFAHFSVSDGNRVQDANLRFTPSAQPFPAGSGARIFAGLYGRKADRKAEHYWSPASGFYTAFLGVAADRAGPDGDIYGELKRSQRIGGEGANGWSVGFGGRRWLSRDWAVRADGFWLETRRDQSAYRAKSATISLEHLW